MKKPPKCLLYEKLISEGWFESEKEALPWIMARKVLVNDQPAFSGKEKVSRDSTIRIREYYKRKYVSKGGLKLEAALKDFGIDINGKIALDCGASTGGFTDCLLHHGAARIYAVDAGNGQLAGKLAAHPAVVNLERTNLGDPALQNLDPAPQIITLDLSYLSLVKALPICRDILDAHDTAAAVICLVKPIYEVESAEIRRSGDINDPAAHREILRELCHSFISRHWSVLGITNSPVTGNQGTLEYFIALTRQEPNPQTGPEANTADPGQQPSQQWDEQLNEQMEAALSRAFQIQKFNKNNFDQINYDEKKYVTRSGLKLEKALEVFDVTVADKICIDIGASEGGFTDCLLRNRAGKVYAVDVAYGIFNWTLRNHPRVVVLERTNARYLDQTKIPEPCGLLTSDVSFISIRKILPAVKKLLTPGGEIISLYKPQFELPREQLGKNGNAVQPESVAAALISCVEHLGREGIFIRRAAVSPIRGNNGNIEFLLYGDIVDGNEESPAAGNQSVSVTAKSGICDKCDRCGIIEAETIHSIVSAAYS